MGAGAVFAVDALDQRRRRRVTHSGVPPESGAARSILPRTPRANFDINNSAVATRKLFDEQPLAQSSGYVVLAWRPATAGHDRLGFAKVRLPNIRDTDLVVSLHCNGRRLWVEAAPDTPRRCRRRLERALPLLCTLIARAIGGEAISRLLQQRHEGGEI
jgi:hypothetical protein